MAEARKRTPAEREAARLERARRRAESAAAARRRSTPAFVDYEQLGGSSDDPGSAGLGSAGLGSAGLGSDGLGSEGLGLEGLGLEGLGSDGPGSAGLGSDGLGQPSRPGLGAPEDTSELDVPSTWEDLPGLAPGSVSGPEAEAEELPGAGPEDGLGSAAGSRLGPGPESEGGPLPGAASGLGLGPGHGDAPALGESSQPDQDAEQVHGALSPEHHERPSGTRRISRHDGTLRRRAAASREPGPGSRRRLPSRQPAARRRGRSHIGRIFALAALVLAAALAWFIVRLFQPFGASPHGRITVVVPARSSSTAIGNLLERDGVISSALFFELRATLAGQRGDLRPGTYHLQLGMSYTAVLAALTKLPPPVRTTNLTIADGHTRQYVAKLLREQGIRGNYLTATRSSPLLNPHAYGAPPHVPSLEGFLFPDTFNLVDPINIKVLVADQLLDFKRRFATVNLSYARSRHLTPYDVLKIASLVEGEAATPASRPLVASVIYNRLADGMMLQMDSTTRYATGNFTGPLTVSQLASRSPYNTRNHFGLPPTPINSPGLAAIQAAAHPAHTNYLYFFAKPCTNQTVFASTYAQFLNMLAADRRNSC